MVLFHVNDWLGEPGSALTPVEPSPQQVVGQQTGRLLFKALAPLALNRDYHFWWSTVLSFFFFLNQQLLLMHLTR